MSEHYHATRFAPDPRRTAVWSALWKHHFRKLIDPGHSVLDLGCGYGDFINNVVASRRIALDQWPGFTDHVRPGIETHVGKASDLTFLGHGSIDFAFASNLFEHLSREEFSKALAAVHSRLSHRGTLNILQPNWRFAYREYWDDYTHVTPWSDIGLRDFLEAHGFDVFSIQPRFLPLTVKSRLPASPLLIHLWLASPIKPGGKQMFLRARRRAN